jgi:ABC-type enterobactin transport system permease subunit
MAWATIVGGILVALAVWWLFFQRSVSWTYGLVILAVGAGLIYWGMQPVAPPSLFTGGRSSWY